MKGEAKMITDNTTEFVSFLEGCEKIYNDYCIKFGFINYDKFSFTVGKKYIRIVRGDSVHCFVNKETGDVLKAAGWKAPAKGSRGNFLTKTMVLKEWVVMAHNNKG